MSIETRFDTTFIARLALREKQIQQTYRPVIGIHKWFARRPGTLFRGLLLSEFADGELTDTFFRGHHLTDKVIADPFMGGGTPVLEANRLGMRVIGIDINPMAYWIVKQALAALDLDAFATQADMVAAHVEAEIGGLYWTRCVHCGETATVKYFLWVKNTHCQTCSAPLDLFPGYLVALNDRHTACVWYCPICNTLTETAERPDPSAKITCRGCGSDIRNLPVARRGQCQCSECGANNEYPAGNTPMHRLFAMEYHCASCRDRHKGRYFKTPSTDDLCRLQTASRRLQEQGDEWIPQDLIPEGDETSRLHRWGYRKYRDMFNDRQLLGLQTLLRQISGIEDNPMRSALATVFSDIVRYQNMLARYDTMALKCQDIFSVHGFPVGLIQCENNLLGIPGVGGGGFRHFVAKYRRAKEFCSRPYEITDNRKKVFTEPERIEAHMVDRVNDLVPGTALLIAADACAVDVQPQSLDGVFTDPPYFDNVQYAELMDFCYVWLRQLLVRHDQSFSLSTTRQPAELTANATSGRGLDHFTDGLSMVFRKMAAGLKPGAPFVFTYHHNNWHAYLPLIVAILDAGLSCTAVLACPAEMAASLHINGTGSSTIDTIFVCRHGGAELNSPDCFPDALYRDTSRLKRANVRLHKGDITCMALGHLSLMSIGELGPVWDRDLTVEQRLARALDSLKSLITRFPLKDLIAVALNSKRGDCDVPIPGGARTARR